MSTQLEQAAKMALEALEADELDMVDDGSGHMEYRIVLAINALRAALEQPLKMQVHPSEFVKLVSGKENMTGIPAYFTEWPNYD